MVEVVFHEVAGEHKISFGCAGGQGEMLLFWQIGDICMLNMRNI
jgi:hypothetical protein